MWLSLITTVHSFFIPIIEFKWEIKSINLFSIEINGILIEINFVLVHWTDTKKKIANWKIVQEIQN